MDILKYHLLSASDTIIVSTLHIVDLLIRFAKNNIFVKCTDVPQKSKQENNVMLMDGKAVCQKLGVGMAGKQ